MAVGHHTILEWSREKYDATIERLNLAFERQAAALYYDTHASAHLIDVFDPEAAGFTPEEWRDVRPVIPHFDLMMVYAFESAPDEVIERWANDHLDGSGSEAIERIAHLRTHASAIMDEWRARFMTASYTMGDVEGDVLITGSAPKVQLLLRLSSFIPGRGPRRLPLGSSRQWLSVALTANEVARLISHLQEFRSLVSVEDDETSEGTAEVGSRRAGGEADEEQES